MFSNAVAYRAASDSMASLPDGHAMHQFTCQSAKDCDTFVNFAEFGVSP
jgi:hypothetical protein